MLLRNPISTTKRFFQRTLESFKNLLSGGGDGGEGSYQRLPKTPLIDPFSCAQKTRHKQNNMLIQPEDEEETSMQKIKEDTQEKQMSLKKSSPSSRLKTVQKSQGERPRRRMEERRDVKMCLVANKLKEMEIVDKANVDHLLDIEEVFHYYSCLTCPAYLDIVDGFFMELYAEFFNSQQQFPFANF